MPTPLAILGFWVTPSLPPRPLCLPAVTLEVGPLAVPLPIKTDGRGFVEWLYLDEGLRITRGNKGSVFIHTRDE